ncbi:ATM interactor-like [Anguilla anguilla]|uniref:ATM interactor-like n=1 Tax=Anguilla anguilla TaxID=7936 RepID=UPI0015A9EED7|nr:ATM interactor-like [Anguilla anguilla]
MAAASESRAHPYFDNAGTDSVKDNKDKNSQPKEIIKPSIMELTKEVRTNILCTVEGCGKILPNTPALNMHLVKSHRVKDGLVNPTVRKSTKGSQKLYCCPVEGCPRGPNRPFSQFSLVKQHFMKMHAEKKHKCTTCSNCYSTEWDLRRHAEDCGKTFHCTCGCPYASRAALLSHIYRTGHELPTEHRYPPVKKRKMEGLLNGATKARPSEHVYQVVNRGKKLLSHMLISADAASHSEFGSQNSSSTKNIPKLLLPKPKMALVNVPVMQFARVPVLLSSADSNAMRSVLLTVDRQGSVMSAIHLLPQSMEAVIPALGTRTLSSRDTMPVSSLGLDGVSVGVQVNLESASYDHNLASDMGHRGKSTSTDIQTDITYLSKVHQPAPLCFLGEALVSSCSQTDISVAAQVQLPVSVETQTLPPLSKITSSSCAQTDTLGQTYSSSYHVTRETQTNYSLAISEDGRQIDQTVMCTEIFNSEALSVSTQPVSEEGIFRTDNTVEEPLNGSDSCPYDAKSSGMMSFSAQTDLLHQNPMADNQTQTMTLFSDIEKMLSDSMDSSALENHSALSDTTASCEVELASDQEQTPGIDFDFEEFLNTVHIQTQTEESELLTLNTETHLESLDIETQTDFLFFNHLPDSDENGRAHSNDLGLEMFDTQTQTDLNFLLDTTSHIPLGNFLKQSSFSVSTESTDIETQTDINAMFQPAADGSQVKLSSTETQTMTSSFESLGSLFLTSNETQTVMDDFLTADLAWNMESHFSSVETQTSDEFLSLSTL